MTPVQTSAGPSIPVGPPRDARPAPPTGQGPRRTWHLRANARRAGVRRAGGGRAGTAGNRAARAPLARRAPAAAGGGDERDRHLDRALRGRAAAGAPRRRGGCRRPASSRSTWRSSVCRVGVAADLRVVTMVAATLLAVVVLVHLGALVRISRHALQGRFAGTIAFYVVAGLALAAGDRAGHGRVGGRPEPPGARTAACRARARERAGLDRRDRAGHAVHAVADRAAHPHGGRRDAHRQGVPGPRHRRPGGHGRRPRDLGAAGRARGSAPLRRRGRRGPAAVRPHLAPQGTSRGRLLVDGRGHRVAGRRRRGGRRPAGDRTGRDRVRRPARRAGPCPRCRASPCRCCSARWPTCCPSSWAEARRWCGPASAGSPPAGCGVSWCSTSACWPSGSARRSGAPTIVQVGAWALVVVARAGVPRAGRRCGGPAEGPLAVGRRRARPRHDARAGAHRACRARPAGTGRAPWRCPVAPRRWPSPWSTWTSGPG